MSMNISWFAFYMSEFEFDFDNDFDFEMIGFGESSMNPGFVQTRINQMDIDQNNLHLLSDSLQ